MLLALIDALFLLRATLLELAVDSPFSNLRPDLNASVIVMASLAFNKLEQILLSLFLIFFIRLNEVIRCRLRRRW